MLLLYLMKTCRRCGGVRSGYGFYEFARIAIEHNYIDQIFHCLHVSRDQVFETITVK